MIIPHNECVSFSPNTSYGHLPTEINKHPFQLADAAEAAVAAAATEASNIDSAVGVAAALDVCAVGYAVGASAALDTSVVDGAAADCDLNHRCGALQSVYRHRGPGPAAACMDNGKRAG